MPQDVFTSSLNLNDQDPPGQTYTQITNDILLQVLAEMKAMRMAMVHIATEGRRAKESDFDPQQNPALQNE